MKQKVRYKTLYLQIARSMLVLLLSFVFLSSFAQERTISGVLTDENGVTLPGVNVIIKGTTAGTITDLDGKFSIKVPGDEAILSFSFVGYIGQEIKVGQQTVMNVTLKEEVKELNEVVVIGYGVQKKKLNTGATLNIGGATIQSLKTNSPMEALKGITPGVSVTQNNGMPGAGTRVVIRGIGTNGNSKPLYVVDGIVMGDIDYLSPSDIETIDVLKDAASSAIYGSRAANGVVLVKTKAGAKEAKTVVTYDAYYGFANIYKKPNLLNAKQYMEIEDEALKNDG
jgi:TonB-dependent starch-binding outer membrane protein SusC